MIGLSNHALFSAATRALLSFFEARPTLRWSVIGLSVNTLVKSPDSSSGVSVTRAVCRIIRYGAFNYRVRLVGGIERVEAPGNGQGRGYGVGFEGGRRASNLPSTVGSILSNAQSDQICSYRCKIDETVR